jgi:hypothetical protein
MFHMVWYHNSVRELKEGGGGSGADAYMPHRGEPKNREEKAMIDARVAEIRELAFQQASFASAGGGGNNDNGTAQASPSPSPSPTPPIPSNARNEMVPPRASSVSDNRSAPPSSSSSSSASSSRDALPSSRGSAIAQPPLTGRV